MDELVVWFTERIVASGGVVPAFIDYFAVVVGVVTGAMFACDRKLDIVGTVVCGLFTAYGGGVLRDFLLQDEGVYFMSHPYLFLLCVFLCVFVFYFRGLFRHLPSTIFLCDTLSVALYAVAGASKAFDCGSGFIMSIVLGAIVGVGGGAIRDSFVGEVPGSSDRATSTPWRRSAVRSRMCCWSNSAPIRRALRFSALPSCWRCAI